MLRQCACSGDQTTIGSVGAGGERTIEIALSGICKRFGANVVLDV
jgi:hypothetical protein